jgi:hypothetical protein
MAGLKLRLLAFAPLVALAISGCGGGSGESSSTRGSAAVPESTKAQAGEEQKGGEASIEEFGSEAGGSGREAILASFSGYLNAIAAKDHAGACSHLASNVQSSLEQIAGKALGAKGCPAILPELLAPTASQIAREQANGKIAKVRVQGDRAFVVFHAPGAELYQLTMVEEGGEWKAASVSASVLVPEL